MEYKQYIIEILDKIKNERILKEIFDYICFKLLKGGE